MECFCLKKARKDEEKKTTNFSENNKLVLCYHFDQLAAPFGQLPTTPFIPTIFRWNMRPCSIVIHRHPPPYNDHAIAYNNNNGNIKHTQVDATIKQRRTCEQQHILCIPGGWRFDHGRNHTTNIIIIIILHTYCIYMTSRNI